MGDKPKGGGAANPRWSNYASIVMGTLVVVVIAMVVFGFVKSDEDNGENDSNRDEASAESRDERPSIASAAVAAVLSRPASTGKSCRPDSKVIGSLEPGERMEIANPRGTSTYYSPDPTTENPLVTVCSKLHPDRCISSETRSVRRVGPVVVMTNTSDEKVAVACITVPAS